jgi:uncharacterized membrane protein
MSGLRGSLYNLSPAEVTFLFCVAMGVLTASVGSVGGNRSPGPLLVVYAVATWIVLGIIFGGLAWFVDTLSLWRTSLTLPSTVERDPALEALRERYARGEIDENQFETMLRHLKEV